MSAEQTAAVRDALRAAGATARGVDDVDAYADFLACVLADDPSAEGVQPAIALALGGGDDNRLAARVAAAVARAWTDPAGWEAWFASTANAADAVDEEAAAEGGSSDGVSAAPAAPPPPPAVTSLPEAATTAGGGAKPGRPFAKKLTQAERRRLEAQPGGAPPVELTSLKSLLAVQPPPPTPSMLLAPGASGDDDDGGARVCRHFLAGGCFRADCAFSHDVRGVACRFWASPAGCEAGADCAFLHAVPGSGGRDIREFAGDGDEQPSLREPADREGDDDGSGDEAAAAAAAAERRAPSRRTLASAAGLGSTPPPPPQTAAAAAQLSGLVEDVVDATGDGDFDIAWVLQRLELIEREAAAAPARGQQQHYDSGGDSNDDDDVASTAHQQQPPPVDFSDAAAFPSLLRSGDGATRATAGAAQAPLAAGRRDPTIAHLPTGSGARTLAAALPASLLLATAPAAAPQSAWGAGTTPQADNADFGGDSTGTRLAVGVLRRAFPTLPPHLVRACYVDASAGARDMRRAAALLAREHGVEPMPGVLTSAPPPSAAAAAAAGGGHHHHLHRGASSGRPYDVAARRVAQSLERVPTGGAVSSLYAALRAEAEAHAKNRNLAFHRATRAYLSGDGAAAARFGRQGREYDEKMRAAHARAAAETFAARNASSGAAGSSSTTAASASSSLPPPAMVDVSGCGLAGASRGGGGGASSSLLSVLPVHVFDLHGLHPSEAADVAEGLVARVAGAAGGGTSPGAVRAPDGCVWLAFLTGTRRHSQKLGKGGGSIHSALLEALATRCGGSVDVYDPPSGLGGRGDVAGGSTSSGVIVVRCL